MKPKLILLPAAANKEVETSVYLGYVADTSYDAYATIYQAYIRKRSDEAHGMAATFEDFIAIHQMGANSVLKD